MGAERDGELPAALLLFPNQLHPELVASRPRLHVFLVEEPLFFTRPDGSRMHKARCAFTVASMRAFAAAHPTIRYVEFAKAATVVSALRAYPRVQLYDPHDLDVRDKYARLLSSKLRVLENPHAFVLTESDLHRFGRVASNKAFFDKVKALLGLHRMIPGSTDMLNRRPFNAEARRDIPPVLKHASPFHGAAVLYVQHTFRDHAGLDWEAEFALPVTHAQARAHLRAFLADRFARFGPFQDAVSQADGHFVGYHAHISFLLNTGLLTPLQVLEAVRRALRRRRDVPINSVEGFLRQLLGWREYMRYLYWAHGREWKRSHLCPSRALASPWYTGATGVAPIDAEILKVLKHAWAHHTVRLMFFLAPMRMAGAHPAAIYRWFMEMVSLDAYDWVMVPNVIAMGALVKGHTRKPYFCSSNYVRAMSDYRPGPWCDVWDGLFYDAIQREPAYARNLQAWRAKPAAERARLLALSRAFKLRTSGESVKV